MSLGGSQTTKVQIPGWLEDAAQRSIGRAESTANIGYMPYMGPDVAAFSPMQQASFDNTTQAAQAFGMATPGMGSNDGMPPPQQFAGGVQGYSSFPVYQQALDALGQARPGQMAAYNDLFIDPRGQQQQPQQQPKPGKAIPGLLTSSTGKMGR